MGATCPGPQKASKKGSQNRVKNGSFWALPGLAHMGQPWPEGPKLSCHMVILGLGHAIMGWAGPEPSRGVQKGSKWAILGSQPGSQAPGTPDLGSQGPDLGSQGLAQPWPIGYIGYIGYIGPGPAMAQLGPWLGQVSRG